MASAWESRGTLWLDGKHYWVKDVLGSDCMVPGTRVVQLDLVEVQTDDEFETEPDEWGYGPNGEIVDLR